MIKLDLNKAAGEFELISANTHLFYNVETGEFDFSTDFMDAEDDDDEKYEEDSWIAAPSQHDIGEYDIMVDFAESVADAKKSELLCVALEGRGAFRRFKDTLSRVDLEDEWYGFRHKAFVKIAQEWCEDNGIEYVGGVQPDEPQPLESKQDFPAPKLAVTMATLESHNHFVGDIERGEKIYMKGGLEILEAPPNFYWAKVPHKNDIKVVTLSFSRDGQNLDKYVCNCSANYNKPPLCRHVVAAVLEIQGGVAESKLALGKSASISAVVDESNIAKTVGSGSLNVFATPMMIALMERAACECLTDCLDEGQTSVGSSVSVEHTVASPLGTEITATATIEYVFGRKIEFKVSACDNVGEIGKGTHVRMIIDSERFMKKAETRKQ